MKLYTEKIAHYTLAGLMTLTALVALGAPVAAHAQSAKYAGERRQIRACVLVSSATSFHNPVPYVFYALDSRADYRPAGWEFINPTAPNTISAQAYNRWKTRGGNADPAFTNGNAQYQLFQIGAALTKNIGAYWEVNLDTATDTTLSQFDVVLLPLQGGRNNGNVAFSATERERLRHFVDQGGTLWVENDGSSQFNAVVGQFVVALQAGGGFPNGVQRIVNPLHTLVTYPYNIAPTEVVNLGEFTNLNGHSPFVDPTNGPVNPRVMVPIIQQAGAVTVYAGDLGAGHIAITSMSVAADLNGLIVGNLGTNGVTGLNTTNDGAVSGNNFASIPPIDLKFAYNLAGWTGGLPAGAANARRTGSSLETVGHGIATKWSTYPVTPLAGNPGSGGVIFKNATFYVDGQNTLHAYDVNPQESLSFNGLTPDDGLADFIYGAPYDEIWRFGFQDGAGIHYSTPTVVSVSDNNYNVTDVVMVSNTAGKTQIFNALPRDPNTGRLLSASPPILTINLETGNNNTVFPPPPGTPMPVPGAAYDDGVLFVPVYKPVSGAPNNNGWHVAAIDLQQSLINNSLVTAFGTGLAGATMPSAGTWAPAVEALGDITGPLSVGYVRDNSTGAIDEVVYVPVAGNPGANPPTPPYVQALWFRTRQEPLQQVTTNGNSYWRPQGDRARVPWFAGPFGAMDLRPVVHITHLAADGSVLDVNDIVYSGGGFSPVIINYQNGIMQITGFNVPAPIGNGDTYTVSADYAVDWPGTNVGSGTLNGQDMANLVTNRRYKLFVDPNQVPLLQPVPTGGAVIGSDDSAILAANSALQDKAMGGGPLPDRIYSLTEQFAGIQNSFNRGRSTASSINWMFAPMHGGSFDGNTIRPRLINGDNFRTKAQANDNIPSGQVVAPANANAAPAFQVIGQPAVSNDVVYVVANAHFNGVPFTTNTSYYNATVILALRERVDNTINLETPLLAQAGTLVLKQPNFSQQATGAPNYITLNVVKDTGIGDFTVDTTTDGSGNTLVTALHILNMQPNGMDAFNTAVPMYLTDGAIQQVPLVNANGYSKLDNLLWWIAIPYSSPNNPVSLQNNSLLLQPELQYIGGSASSGPSVFGQTLYYNATYKNNGHLYGSIVTVDLKSATDGRLIDATTGSSRVHVVTTMTDPNTGGPFDLLTAGVNTPLINPPLATANTVVDGAAAGLAAMDNQVTLIADGNRLIEVDALSNALWTLSSTSSTTIAGGPLTGASGIVASQNVPLAHPTTARHTDANVYAIADTQNNRVLQLDHGGQVITEIHGLNNQLGFLTPGEPLTLNHPTDVQIYTDQQPNGTISILNRVTGATYSYSGPYYAIHYIIADGGNYRALEIVSIYNPNTGAPVMMNGPGNPSMLQQVIFSTRSLAEQNVNYHYRTIQQFKDPTTITGGDPTTAQVVMIAAVDNVKQSATEGTANVVSSVAASSEGPGGSLMIIKRYTFNGGNSTDGDVASIVNSISIPNATNTRVVRRQPLSGPTFFREFDYVDPKVSLTQPIPRYLLCDSNGCYLLVPRHVDANGNITNGAINELVVDWMLSDADYYYLTGRHLRATSIQRLTQAEIYTDANGVKGFAPHYLITNSYTGRDSIEQIFGNPANVANGEIHGEVFEIRSRDYYDLPNGAATVDTDGLYNGYHFNNYGSPNIYQLYTIGQDNGVNFLALNQPSQTGNITGSSIVRMVPAETLSTKDAVTNQYIKLPILRSIGDPSNGTTSSSLQQPLFSERPF